MKKLMIALSLMLALSVQTFALEVPNQTVVQNLNGRQQVVKTYTLSPDADPQELVEEPFTLDGYRYTFADIIKTENHVDDTVLKTETVTLETEKDDLSQILAQLSPTTDYDDGMYSGKLALDHTSIHTEAAGYETRHSTLRETKVIDQLDRNDMSYVPGTTVKNGCTLSLSNVEWRVTGTELVGETLIPSSYQAVATYSGSTAYRAATGYVTTAEYTGEVSRTGVESVTYTVTYLGEEAGIFGLGHWDKHIPVVVWLLAGLALLAAVGLVVLVYSRRKAAEYAAYETVSPMEYEESEERL